VPIVHSPKEATELFKEPGFFASRAPYDFLGGFSPGKMGELRRLFALIEEPVEGHLKGPGKLLKGLDGGHGVAVLHPRDVRAEKTAALFDVPLREVFYFADCAEAVGDKHAQIMTLRLAINNRRVLSSARTF